MKRHLIFLGLSLFGCASTGSSAPAYDAGGAPVEGDGGDGGASEDGAGDGGEDGAPLDGSEDGAPGDGASADDAGTSEPPAPCNGHVELCARRYDEVVYAGTHNAHAAEEYGYSTLNRNQLGGFRRQLDDGVRALLVDVYDKDGDHKFCHNPDLCFLGSLGHVEGLSIIKAFLDERPREVVTLVYQNGMSGDMIADDMRSIGLDAYAFSYDAARGFPTLGEMIATNQRLVVTIESGDATTPWVKNVWALTWDTPYTFFEIGEFNCDKNRGELANPLFMINHWLNANIPIVNIQTPDETKSKAANAYDVLYGRAKGCWDQSGKLPNFVVVDFYEHGDLLRVVDALNGL